MRCYVLCLGCVVTPRLLCSDLTIYNGALPVTLNHTYFNTAHHCAAIWQIEHISRVGCTSGRCWSVSKPHTWEIPGRSLSVTDEIALFIDFENIRYSLINVQRREPDPQELIALARRFGTVMVARAYADWSRQPEFFKGSLTAAMIDRVDCPAKVRERFRQNPTGPMMGQPYAPQSPYGQGQLPAEGDMEAEEYDDEGEDE